MDGAMTALPLVFDAPRRGMPPRHLADLTREEARAAVAELGQPAFRADQLARHFYRGVTDPAQMTDVPAAARETLAEALLPGLLTVVRHQTADNGRTRKTLWRLHDGALVESVLMRYPDRATVCISSQAGCGMACPFCATGQQGLTRNLSAAEIIGQAVAAARRDGERRARRRPRPAVQRRLHGHGRAAGELRPRPQDPRRAADPGPARPRALAAVGHRLDRRPGAGDPPAHRGGPQRHPRGEPARPGRRAARHPRADQHPLEGAARSSTRPTPTPKRTGRRYSVEYALIRDVNDQPFRADLLGKLLAGRLAHVNLIPLNPTPGSQWDASPLPAQREFVARLRAAGVATTVRDTRGQDIDGACGQLAAADAGRRRARASPCPTPSVEPPMELGAEGDE